MKTAIGIFGIPRGSLVTHASIMENLVRPAEAIGEVHLFGHLFQQDNITNARSGESGKLADADYKRFENFSPAIEEADRCLTNWGFDNLTAFGDIYNDNYRSIRNLIHQLHSLNSVTIQIKKIAPDVVIFARPDLLYHQPLKPNLISSAATRPNRIYVPEWQWWNGYNDRFSICGKFAFKTYGTRIKIAHRYCLSTGSPLHAERLLRFALEQSQVSIRTLNLRASRVRLKNIVKEENFNALETLGHDSRRLYVELRLRQMLSALHF